MRLEDLGGRTHRLRNHRPVTSWPPRRQPVPTAEPILRRRGRRSQPVVPWYLAAWALLLVTAFGTLHGPIAAARTDAPDPSAARSGSFYVRSEDSFYAEALRQHTRMTAEVTGIVARVTVEQTFENPGDEWVEGLYIFPLPEQAAVDKLVLQVGMRRIVGEIREKEDARRRYREAGDQGQRAGLIEQNRPNVFRARVANVGPRERVVVTLGYLQIIEPQANEYRLRFPLSMTPRYTPTPDAMRTAITATADVHSLPGAAAGRPDATEDAVTNPPLAPPDVDRQSVELILRIDAGLPLEQVASPSHSVTIRDLGRAYEIRLSEGAVAPDRDFELSWTPQLGSGAQPVTFLEESKGYWHLLLMVMPPHQPAPSLLPRELIFVIDTSGSMHGQSIEQARTALIQGLRTLGSADRFNIIQFNSYTEMLYQSSVPVTTERLAQAREYVAALQADGGTEMQPALHAALAATPAVGFLRQVVFITDGAVSNERELLGDIESRLGQARLFTVGIGSAPNAHFMRSAATAGNGSFTFIASGAQVSGRMADLLGKLEHPALTDIELGWPHGSTPELAPSRIPDLYVGEPVLISARLRERPRGLLTMSGRSAAGYWVRQISLDTISGTSLGVAALWARSRIGELVDARLHVSDEADRNRQQITRLALDYGLLSPYTSLVAIEDQPVRPLTASLRPQTVPITAPHGDAQVLSASALPVTGTHAGLLIRIGVLLLLAGLILSRQGRPDS